MTSFAISGADIASGGNFNTNSGGGSNGQGEVTMQFSNGADVFESDDIVVFEVVGATADGEIGAGSAISDITVFDSYSDYQAYLDSGSTDTSFIKYDYKPQNPGQTGNIQSDISGLGDTYVRFNNVFVPEPSGPTSGGPTIPGGSLTIAPGTGIGSGTGGSTTIDRVSNFDLDYDGSIDPSNIETGNSNFFIGDYVEILNGGPICWAAGARIATARGDVPVETLGVGDLVQTLDHGLQPIRWVGQQSFPARAKCAPVRFDTGSIGNETPFEVSQNHRLLVGGMAVELLFGTCEVLVAAKHLLNTSTIQLRGHGRITYVHMLLDHHEVVAADGVYSETLHPSIGSALQNGREGAGLFAVFSKIEDDAFGADERDARRCLTKHEANALSPYLGTHARVLLTKEHSPRHPPLRAAS